MPVRVFQDEDTTGSRPVAYPPDTRRMAQGIAWAVRNGADVINVSMSTRPTDDALPELKAALDLARRKDVVVVASGGNQDVDEAFTQMRYPAGGDGVIGVAATNQSGEVDNWSIHGAQNDVSAPGSDVLISYHANGDCLGGSGPRVHQLGHRVRHRARGPAAAAVPEGVGRPDRLPDHGLGRPPADV